MSIFENLESPNQPIHLKVLKDLDIELWMKREDLSHGHYGGNKLRKLKYHINNYNRGNYKGIVTFGGAWSNHIYATSALLKELKIESIGIIRGEEPSNYSDTLDWAKKQGMKLIFVSRTLYREKDQKNFIQSHFDLLKNHYIIPEGGSGDLGILGCSEILSDKDVQFDFISCACGTGATLAGISNSLKSHQRAIGFPVLKGGEFLKIEILNGIIKEVNKEKFEIITDYHFGGYAKINEELIQFMKDFFSECNIKLDPIYNAKALFGLIDQIIKGRFPKKSKILYLNTGGIQGIKGIERKLGKSIYP